MSLDTAIFAGGCFWCMVRPFDTYPGIEKVESGYTGGHVANPTYEQVCSGTTGHTEAVKITFDPSKVSYKDLVEIYWHQTDPTDASGQFQDRGDNYRPVIFVKDDNQRQIAEASKKALQESGQFGDDKIVTAIEDAQPFYLAEDYHQDFYKKNPQRFALEEALPTNLDFPMSSEHTTVRMNLISGLLDDLAYNAARKVNDVALYEQGRVFFRDEDQTRPREVEHIAGVVTGLVNDANWNTTKQEVDFFYLKGIVANLLHELGVTNEAYQATAMPDMHPGRTAAIYAGETYLGFIGEVHPNTAKEYKLKQRVYVFELDLQKVIELPKEAKLYTPVSKYPSITRDIALAVSTAVTNQQIEDCIRKNGGAFLKDIKLFDVYQGEHIMAGFKSLAYTLVYSDPNATLQDEAVTKAFEKVQAKLVEEFKADIR